MSEAKKKIEKKVFYNFLKYHDKRMLTFMVTLEEPNGWTIIIKRMFLKYKLILWILSYRLRSLETIKFHD
jgi:hypothetical protein